MKEGSSECTKPDLCQVDLLQFVLTNAIICTKSPARSRNRCGWNLCGLIVSFGWKVAVKPILQALVLAESVFTLEDGRKIICGTFSKITGRASNSAQKDESGNTLIPAGGPGTPWAYICLTGVADQTVLQLQFVSLRQNTPLFQTEVKLNGQDRLATVELAVPLPHLGAVIDSSGGYAFDVVCDDEILGSWRIEVEITEDNDINENDDSKDKDDDEDNTE